MVGYDRGHILPIFTYNLVQFDSFSMINFAFQFTEKIVMVKKSGGLALTRPRIGLPPADCLLFLIYIKCIDYSEKREISYVLPQKIRREPHQKGFSPNLAAS